MYNTVYEGDNVTFTCIFSNQGRPNIYNYQWSINGMVLPHATASNLRLTSISRGEENVTCNGRNVAGWGKESNLEMEILIGPTFIQTLPPHTNVLESVTEIIMSCEVK